MAQIGTQEKLFLTWGKCSGGKWCPLNTVDLSNATFSNSGVYVIWHGGSTGRYVYVGQGELRDRLTFHRANPKVQAYKSKGLYVTWAKVAVGKRDGVEVYLAEALKPLVGDRHPVATPIPVNHPAK